MKRIVATALITLLCATSAQAVSETCREWQSEHAEWKARVLGLALEDAPRRVLDEAVFELLQREAYLTSCPARIASQRIHMVGWRLVDRSPDEFASAVVESVLEEGGFDLTLRNRFDPVLRTAQRGR